MATAHRTLRHKGFSFLDTTWANQFEKGDRLKCLGKRFETQFFLGLTMLYIFRIYGCTSKFGKLA